MGEFGREIRWEPGYDTRDDENPAKRSCHGLNIRWLLIGDEGAVQFLIFTMWLPTLYGEQGWRAVEKNIIPPMAADLGYHWLTPQHNDQDTFTCDVLPGGSCYYDGSGLRAAVPMRLLLTAGDAAVWSFLEAEYRALSESLRQPRT